MPDPGTALPLCIDLDGTLTHTDLSVESLLVAVRNSPWIVFLLPAWFMRGKAYLKQRLSDHAEIDVSVLPYHEEVIALVRQARHERRRTVLVTGSHSKFAEQVGCHLGLFDEIMATHADCNLTGLTKAKALNERFGEHGFEYVANGSVDLPVWRFAAASVTVNTPRDVIRKVRQLGRPHANIPGSPASARAWLKAIRIHQWAKNALLFVPLITAHEILDPAAFLAVLIAFLCFGLCASATYIVNDLFDLESDRHHARKKHRPFAAGLISAKAGIIGAGLLIATGLGLALLLPPAFRLALGAYIVSTLLYSFRLKRVASLDVLILAGLYTLRVIAGAFAAGITLSFWLLAFSMFIFLCLALVKRVAELIELRKRGANNPSIEIRGREYSTQDIPILQTLGATSGYLAVLVLALYINSPEVLELYHAPEILWLIAPLLLLWVTRLWIVTTRGYMDEDPIFFAIKDPETWITAVITGLILVAATFVAP
jgi:4-hydroxybenzoate polyprenyltransferase/phosphoserine phosphatase